MCPDDPLIAVLMEGFDKSININGLGLEWTVQGDWVIFRAVYKGQEKIARTTKQDFMERFGSQIQAAEKQQAVTI